VAVEPLMVKLTSRHAIQSVPLLASAALYAILVTGPLGDCRKILYQATPD